MSLFAYLQVETDIEKAEDRVGGGSFAKVDKTGLYEFKIEKAYAHQSSGGAYGVTVHMKSKDGANFQTTEWVTSGSAKGCKNYFLDKDGKKQFLPGYNKIKNLDALIGFDRAYPKTTKGKVMLWDFDSKQELPQEKEIITEWIGKEVNALIVKRLEDGYKDPTKPAEKYEVEHFLDAKSNQTRNEKVAGMNGFKDKWLERHTPDFVIDKRVQSKSYVAGTPMSDIQVEDDDMPFGF